MSGLRTEHRHHTDEQIREAIVFASELVDELGVAGDLRGAAFVKAVELRVAKHIEQTVPALGVLAPPSQLVPGGGR